MGKWGQLPPGKMDEKLKSENMQKKRKSQRFTNRLNECVPEKSVVRAFKRYSMAIQPS